MEKLGTGAHESPQDSRTIIHSLDTATPLVSGGFEYIDHEHQHSVGICTAISLVQLREKATGKKYSPDFQYLLQKKFVDFNWAEGSSVFNSLKVGKNYGFLPIELMTHITEADRFLPYSQYVAKLQSIPESEVQRLILLCTDKIPGYAQVTNDPQSIAKAIVDSDAGVLCRYGCQSNWWTPSWQPKDIDPLKYAPETSGHAIIMSSFDYSVPMMQKLANTWGNIWDLGGNAHINWNNYPPTEVWTILKTTPVIPPYIFTKTLRFKDIGTDVRMLQKKLGITPDGIFGNITLRVVRAFQLSNKLNPDGIVGPKTNELLNKLP